MKCRETFSPCYVWVPTEWGLAVFTYSEDFVVDDDRERLNVFQQRWAFIDNGRASRGRAGRQAENEENEVDAKVCPGEHRYV